MRTDCKCWMDPNRTAWDKRSCRFWICDEKEVGTRKGWAKMWRFELAESSGARADTSSISSEESDV